MHHLELPSGPRTREKEKERSGCETKNICEGVEDKKRARTIRSGGWWIVLFLARLSIYSLLMNQVWLFLFLPRPRARLLLWAGRFLSVPPRLHPGIKSERGRGDGEREILSRYVRPVSTATLRASSSPSLSSWFDVNWNTEDSDGTGTLSREVSDTLKHTYQSLTLCSSDANTFSCYRILASEASIINMISVVLIKNSIPTRDENLSELWRVNEIDKRISSRSGSTMRIAHRGG